MTPRILTKFQSADEARLGTTFTNGEDMSHLKGKSNKITTAVKSAPVAEDMKWRAEDDLRTLARAQEIQKDRERMKACKSCARDQMKTLAKVTGAGSTKKR